MSKEKIMPYRPEGRFVVRMPFLPVEMLREGLKGRANLLRLAASPKVDEAIYVASPVLHVEMRKALGDPGSVKEKDMERIVNSLARYVSRMATRCTPFGLFAGCAVGTVEEETSIVTDGSVRRHARLDMDFLYKLYTRTMATPEARERVRYYPNTSLYKVGRAYRYVEMQLAGQEREYHIVEVERSRFLDRVLRTAKDGATAGALAGAITGKEVATGTAVEFVNALVDSQVLIPELNQAVTGDDFLKRFAELCRRIYPEDDSRLTTIEEIRGKIMAINGSETFSTEGYEEVAEMVARLDTQCDRSRLFQVDCSFGVSATIGSDVTEEVSRAMSFLNRWKRYGSNSTLDKFMSDFRERYDTQEIPLMEALDPDAGIGYPSGVYSLGESPLLKGYAARQGSPAGGMQMGLQEKMLFDKAMKAIEEGGNVILTDDDVSGSEEKWNDFPPTIGAMFELYKDGQGYYIHFMSASGGSAANLLSRFAHIDDSLYDVVKSITEYEERAVDGAYPAEIVHMPEGRIGNILSRPDMRGHKILYMACPTGAEGEMRMDDITVSVKDEKILLQDRGSGMKIVPYLTSAHNYSLRTMPVYRFLCDMQRAHSVMFSWGALEQLLEFRPRVVYGRTILAPASWSVGKKDYEGWHTMRDDAELLSAVEEWRQKRRIPSRTLLVDSDNKLYVEWDNALSVRAIASIIWKRPSIKMEEVLFSEANLVAEGRDGHYTNQIILPYCKKL